MLRNPIWNLSASVHQVGCRLNTTRRTLRGSCCSDVATLHFVIPVPFLALQRPQWKSFSVDIGAFLDCSASWLMGQLSSYSSLELRQRKRFPSSCVFFEIFLATVTFVAILIFQVALDLIWSSFSSLSMNVYVRLKCSSVTPYISESCPASHHGLCLPSPCFLLRQPEYSLLNLKHRQAAGAPVLCHGLHLRIL
jgi:hypothetical protein